MRIITNRLTPIIVIIASQCIYGCCTRTVSIDGGMIQAETIDTKPYRLDKIMTDFNGHEADISALIEHAKTTNTNLIPISARIITTQVDESTWLQKFGLIPSVFTLTLCPFWKQEKWTATIYLIDNHGHTIDVSSFDAHTCISNSILPIPLLAQDVKDDYYRFDLPCAEAGYNVTRESFHFAKFIWRQSRNKALQRLSNIRKESK